jgi:hypothetical protein
MFLSDPLNLVVLPLIHQEQVSLHRFLPVQMPLWVSDKDLINKATIVEEGEDSELVSAIKV